MTYKNFDDVFTRDKGILMVGWPNNVRRGRGTSALSQDELQSLINNLRSGALHFVKMKEQDWSEWLRNHPKNDDDETIPSSGSDSEAPDSILPKKRSKNHSKSQKHHDHPGKRSKFHHKSASIVPSDSENDGENAQPSSSLSTAVGKASSFTHHQHPVSPPRHLFGPLDMNIGFNAQAGPVGPLNMNISGNAQIVDPLADPMVDLPNHITYPFADPSFLADLCNPANYPPVPPVPEVPFMFFSDPDSINMNLNI